MTTNLYPLRFESSFRQYIWGGRRLETVLGKQLGPGEHFAESWEVVDHGEDQSIVGYGKLRGTPLAEIRQRFAAELFGHRTPPPQFPLLFKYLDAQQNLSIQVHPDDAYAARMNPPDFGKTEAWVVLHADPESLIYAGLKRGFDRAAFEREVRRGVAHLCVHRFHPSPGDCVFIPAGVVHAIGAGLLIAEIQQSSDTTFRIYDWNRIDSQGKPRPLHIEQALEVIDYQRGPISPQIPQPTERSFAERLVTCDKFVLERWTLKNDPAIVNDQQFHILSVLAGEVVIEGDPAEKPLVVGQTALLPASVATRIVAQPRAVVLDMTAGSRL